MHKTLQLMNFDPVTALHDDQVAGTQKRLIFYQSIDVDAVDDRQMSMLAHAASAGDAQAVEILLERGANPNATDKYGLTPLMHLACAPRGWQNMPESVELTAMALLKAGASLLPRDSSGRNAAFIAVDSFLYPFFVAIDHCGAKVSGRLPDSGFTLLHSLCNALVRSSSIEQEESALLIAVILVKKLGLDPQSKTAVGKTARDLAIAHHSRLIAPWLVYGDNVFKNNELAQLQLQTLGINASEAARMRRIDSLQALLQLGEVYDEPCIEGVCSGLTPLSCAASVVDADIINLLIDAGASPTACINAKTQDGRDVVGTSAMRMLLWAPQSQTTLPTGLTADDWARALSAMLRVQGAADAPIDPECRTPLLCLAQNVQRGWQAGERSWPELATSLLLANGANPNRPMPASGDTHPFSKVPGGITALGLLACHGGVVAENMAIALLQAGAHVNAADITGSTPLMHAAQISSPSQAESFVELLLQNGADPTLKNNAAQTALDLAAGAGNEVVVELLFSALQNQNSKQEETVLSSSEENSEALQTDFFSQIRAMTSASAAKADPADQLDHESKPPVRSSNNAHNASQTQSASFFERMRQHSSVSAKQFQSNDGELNHLSSNLFKEGQTLDLAKRVQALKAFLSLALAPVERVEEELELLALGLLSGRAQNDDMLLARRTADLFIALQLATEMDWKVDRAEFCDSLQGLLTYEAIRNAGFSVLPLQDQAEDEVAAYARAFDELAKLWGWSVKLVELSIDGDSYVFVLLNSLNFNRARQLAQQAGLTLRVAEQIR